MEAPDTREITADLESVKRYQWQDEDVLTRLQEIVAQNGSVRSKDVGLSEAVVLKVLSGRVAPSQNLAVATSQRASAYVKDAITGRVKFGGYDDGEYAEYMRACRKMKRTKKIEAKGLNEEILRLLQGAEDPETQAAKEAKMTPFQADRRVPAAVARRAKRPRTK